jgi:hypothetical protein
VIPGHLSGVRSDYRRDLSGTARLEQYERFAGASQGFRTGAELHAIGHTLDVSEYHIGVGIFGEQHEIVPEAEDRFVAGRK